MTSAFQDAILGHIAAADPLSAEATEVFLKVCMQEDASLLQYVHALMELKDLGLIAFVDHDDTRDFVRLTENGRQYVSELISEALLALSAAGKVAEA